MSQRISKVNNFCVTFGAGLFLFLAIGASAILTESIFRTNSNFLFVLMILFPTIGKMLVDISQSKNHPVIKLMFLLLAIGASAILTESIFHGNSPFMLVTMIAGPHVMRLLVKLSQAKDHPAIRFVLAVFSIVGGVALFGAISIILCVLGSWAIQAMT